MIEKEDKLSRLSIGDHSKLVAYPTLNLCQASTTTSLVTMDATREAITITTILLILITMTETVGDADQHCRAEEESWYIPNGRIIEKSQELQMEMKT